MCLLLLPSTSLTVLCVPFAGTSVLLGDTSVAGANERGMVGLTLIASAAGA